MQQSSPVIIDEYVMGILFGYVFLDTAEAVATSSDASTGTPYTYSTDSKFPVIEVVTPIVLISVLVALCIMVASICLYMYIKHFKTNRVMPEGEKSSTSNDNAKRKMCTCVVCFCTAS